MEGTKNERMNGAWTGWVAMREVLSEGDYYVFQNSIRLARHRIHPLVGEEQEKVLEGLKNDRVSGTWTRQVTMRAVSSEGDYYVFQNPIRLVRHRIHPLEAEEEEKMLEGTEKDHLSGARPVRTRRTTMREVLSESK